MYPMSRIFLGLSGRGASVIPPRYALKPVFIASNLVIAKSVCTEAKIRNLKVETYLSNSDGGMT